MSKHPFLLSLVVILAGLKPLAAERGTPSSFLLLNLEQYTVGGMDDAFKKNAQENAAYANGNGVPSNATVNATAGFGFRAGLMFPLQSMPSVALGFSVGYIVGPHIEEILEASSGPAGRLKGEVDTRYLRVLFEGVKRFPVTQKLSFKLRGGLGLAQAHTRQATTELSGSMSTLFADGTTTESETGPTWEFSPSLVWAFNATALEVGLRYAGFPTIGETDDTTEVEWHPVGLFVGFGF